MGRVKLIPWRKLGREAKLQRLKWLSHTCRITSPRWRLLMRCQKRFEQEYADWLEDTHMEGPREELADDF